MKDSHELTGTGSTSQGKAETQLKVATRLVVVGIGFATLACGFFYMLASRQDFEIRNSLKYFSPRFLHASFLLILCGFIVASKDLWRVIVQLQKRFLYAALAIALGALLAAAFMPPRTHRIFYDEQIYEGTGLNIALDGDAAMANEGEFRYGQFHATQEEYNKQPNAWPYLISIVFRVFGSHEQLVFLLCNLLFAVGTLVVFGIGWRLSGEPWAGIFGAIMYCTIPVNLQWANTTTVEISAGVFAAVTVLACILFAQTGSTPLLLVTTALCAFSVQFRPESLLILPVCAVVVIAYRPCTFREIRFYACTLLFFALTVVHWFHSYVVRNENWGSVGQKIGLDYFLHNLATNGLFYLMNVRFPVVYTILAFIAIINIRRLRGNAVLGVWFLLFWGIFLCFYAGSYEYGADVRFSLLSYAPIAVLAGNGLFWLTLLGEKRRFALAKPIAVVLLLVNLSAFLPMIRAIGEEAWEARADQRYAEEFADLVPPDGIVYAHDPCIFHVRGKSSAQLSMLSPGTNLEELGKRFPGGVFMHWGFWCIVPDPGQNQFGKRVLDAFEYEVVKEFAERDRRYILYKLLRHKTDQETPSPSSVGKRHVESVEGVTLRESLQDEQ